ncbi:MAG: hypothetical protein FGM52_09510 [Mycobacterium sp.]|nr:hypothetical protein [Mycobacterium sp.]
MSHKWLLIETLGPQPAVVAVGLQTKNFVPITVFFRRNPNLADLCGAITHTVRGRSGLALSTVGGSRVIYTEPVVMTDDRVHGVQLWFGPADTELPERPAPGAYVVDLNLGESAVTPQFLINLGKDPAVEPLAGRSMADDIPAGAFNVGEAQLLSWTVDFVSGRTFAANWGFRDGQGLHRRVGFCVRGGREATSDGAEHLIARSMNLFESVGAGPPSTYQLAQRLIDAMARPGHYRAIIDLNTWTLIKWVDGPCPLYDWRARAQMHPDDAERLAAQMVEELAFDQTSAVLRLPARGGGWTPIHVTINRIELDVGVFAGLATLRLPTDEEGAATTGSARQCPGPNHSS